jgi:hypothetical protein
MRRANYNDFSEIPFKTGPAIYIVSFTNGALKIGQSGYPRSRLHQVGSQARRLWGKDVLFSGVFISPELKESRLLTSVEWNLCWRARRLGQNVGRSREYFTGVNFDEIVAAVPAVIAEEKRNARAYRRLAAKSPA